MARATYRRRTQQGVLVWDTEKLWVSSASLPVICFPLKDIPALDQVRWFSRNENGPQPTCRAVAIHAKMIFEADLRYPIILAADGDVMDGMHRIAKALQLGLSEINAVQYAVDPLPDRIEPYNSTGLASFFDKLYRSLLGKFPFLSLPHP